MGDVATDPGRVLGVLSAAATLAYGVLRALAALKDLRAKRAGAELAREAQEEAQRRAVLAAGVSPFGEPSTSDRALQEARVRIVELERDMARLQAKLEEALRVRRDIEHDNEDLADALTRKDRELAMRDVTIKHLRARERSLEYQLGDALAVELVESRTTPDPKPVKP